MLKISAVALITLITFGAAVSATAYDRPYRKSVRIQGYVSHGVNIYNSERIGDYSSVSSSVLWLNPTPLIDEVRAYDETTDSASVITEETDRSRLIATSDTFFNFMNPGSFINPDVVNKPIGNIGSNFFGFSFSADRVVPEEFPASDSEPVIHRARGVRSFPTIEQWDKISGLISVRERRNGNYRVRVTIRDGFPNGIYTLWDVGAMNPLTENEQGYAIPMGGLPNLLVTDAKGCATAVIDMPYSIVRSCEEGAESCSSYINAVYHWDAQTYGASPGQTMLGLPAGVLAANQLTWPTSGEILIDPPTEFRPKRHGCY